MELLCRWRRGASCTRSSNRLSLSLTSVQCLKVLSPLDAVYRTRVKKLGTGARAVKVRVEKYSAPTQYNLCIAIALSILQEKLSLVFVTFVPMVEVYRSETNIWSSCTRGDEEHVVRFPRTQKTFQCTQYNVRRCCRRVESRTDHTVQSSVPELKVSR